MLRQISLFMLLLFLGTSMSYAQSAPEKPEREKLTEEERTQKKEERMEKIQALHKAFINMKLELTETEQAAFWPIYDEYKQKGKALGQSLKKKGEKGPRGKKGNKKELTDAELEDMMNRRMEFQRKSLELKEACHNELKAVISIQKLAKLPKAERRFKAETMRRMKGERGKGKGKKGARKSKQGMKEGLGEE